MSFQVYLDTIETKTGLTPRQLLEIAQSKGFSNVDKGRRYHGMADHQARTEALRDLLTN